MLCISWLDGINFLWCFEYTYYLSSLKKIAKTLWRSSRLPLKFLQRVYVSWFWTRMSRPSRSDICMCVVAHGKTKRYASRVNVDSVARIETRKVTKTKLLSYLLKCLHLHYTKDHDISSYAKEDLKVCRISFCTEIRCAECLRYVEYHLWDANTYLALTKVKPYWIYFLEKMWMCWIWVLSIWECNWQN